MVRKNSTPEDQEIIEEKCEALVAMFVQLKDLQAVAGMTENTANENPILDDENKDNEYENSATQIVMTQTSIKRKTIILPSNGNVQNNASDLEIRFRIMQADSQINQL